MSIVRQLIRIALVEACRGRTLAGSRVYDSRMDTLDGLMAGERQPVLIFSIEEAESRRADQTDGLVGRLSVFTVVVQAVVASGQEVVDNGEVVIMPAIGETDAAFEALLDFLDRQWRVCLHGTDNAWAEVLRGLMLSLGVVKDQRVTDPETGVKHAARIVQFDLEAIADPLPGDDLPDVIDAGLALMEADGDAGYAQLAAQWRLELSGSGGADWRALQAALFASAGDTAALGYADLGGEDGEALTEVQIDAAGIGPIEPVTAG